MMPRRRWVMPMAPRRTRHSRSAAANGLLANDSDPEGDALMLVNLGEQRSGNGTVVLSSDGAFEYTPDENFAGTDTFTYTVEDSEGVTSTATVTLSVNHAPEAADDSAHHRSGYGVAGAGHRGGAGQ
ncbi:MAG: cadherin-like domain-containing protein [Gammaproteobacteria bacterium]|nr:cadherin-like domain-containing protein [Gammaproteobacteria bacterium]